MAHTLQRHPASEGAPSLVVEADVRLPSPRSFHVIYSLQGDVGALVIQPPQDSRREDGLWRSTCFELFAKPDGGEAYWEFNFSPSTAWAAYRFDAYRTGGEVEAGFSLVSAIPKQTGDGFELLVVGELSEQTELSFEDTLLGLSAVIETHSGELSYWALSHPPGKPDFHHASCFALSSSSVIS